jgi:hypothetical protein
VRATENRIAGNKVIPLFQKGHEGGEDGAHARGSSVTCFRTFERTNPVGKFLDTGVTETAVYIIIGFIGESRAHIFRIVKTKTACEKHWRRMFHFIGPLGLYTNGLGDRV